MADIGNCPKVVMTIAGQIGNCHTVTIGQIP